MSVKFKDIEEQLCKLILEMPDACFPGEDDGFILVDGICNLPLDNTIGTTICDRLVPAVTIVGNTSGRMYFISLKKIMPDLDI